jgi:alpha-tubulin suppressor-like RCC1 family protein
VYSIVCKQFAIGIDHNGSVKSVYESNNDCNQLNYRPPYNKKFVDLACGKSHTSVIVGITDEGTVCAWGSNNNNHHNDIPQETGAIKVVCGVSHSFILFSNGSVKTFGDNDSGQRDNNPIDKDNIAIACGSYHSVAIKKCGMIVVWGNNDNGQRLNCPDSGSYVTIACGRNHTVSLNQDGSVIVFGQNKYRQYHNAPLMKDFISIACGDYVNCGLRKDNSVITWGSSKREHSKKNYISISASNFNAVYLNIDGSISVNECTDLAIDRSITVNKVINRKYKEILCCPSFFIALKMC